MWRLSFASHQTCESSTFVSPRVFRVLPFNSCLFLRAAFSTAGTDEVVKALSQHCLSVEKINLSGSYVGDEGVNSLSDYVPTRIRSLDLSWCPNITGQPPPPFTYFWPK